MIKYFFPLFVSCVITIGSINSASAQTVIYTIPNDLQSVAAAVPTINTPGFSSSAQLVGYDDRTSSAPGYLNWSRHPETLIAGRYLQFSIINETTPFTLTEFSFTPKRYGDRYQSMIEVRFSTSETDFNSNYITVFATETPYTLLDTPISISLTSSLISPYVSDITTGYFRIYTYNATDNGAYSSGIWLGAQDIQITAVAIPEQSSLALTGAILLGSSVLLVAQRRCKKRQQP